MNKLYKLKKYYRELMQSISLYNDIINVEMKSLDLLIAQEINDISSISLLNNRLQRDSRIESMILIIQDYFDIRKAKQDKANQVKQRIKQYESYMAEHKLI